MRTLLAIIRSLVMLVFFLSFIILLLVFSVITFRKWNLRFAGPVLRVFGRLSLKILGIKLTLQNEWPFKEDEARVVIVNHQSTLDIIWFSAICPNRLSTIGKRELMWVPFLNIAWWAFRMFYIDRSNREAAVQTMKMAAANTIKYKRSVSLAPEGTRTKDGHILPFKKGVFHLALDARLPIYPLVVCGAAEAMPKHTFWAYPEPITIKFLSPISTQDWTEDNLDEHINQVREAMSVAYYALRDEVGLPKLTSPTNDLG
jgi:1-acyl-sn-glycerol-3-phosphate acyltransferase